MDIVVNTTSDDGGSPMRRVLAVLLLLSSFAFVACANDPDDADTDDAGGGGEGVAVTVASPDFTEGRILGEIYAGALEAEGFEVTKKLGLGARDILMKGLMDGDIDVVPEYTGNLLRFVTDSPDAPDTSDETYAALVEPLAEMDLVVLEQSEAEDKDGVVVTKETAEELELEKVSDLTEHASDMVFAGPSGECEKNPACLKGLQDVYNLEFKEFQGLAPGAPTVTALKEGAVDAANIFSTDGAIAANDFVVLEDDKRIAGAQNVVPLVRQEIADQSDALADVLNAVSSKLTTEGLTELNARVDIDKEDADEVAADWLSENGFSAEAE
jgi:osmoprotectant transport system substrate-binding protein